MSKQFREFIDSREAYSAEEEKAYFATEADYADYGDWLDGNSYQANCEAYALFGNPARDAMEYEENARYDQFDGRREEFHDENDADLN